MTTPTRAPMPVRRTAALAVATLAGGAALFAAVPSPAHAATAAAPTCRGTALAVTATQPQGAAGHGNLVLRFRNTGSASCRLHGYPGLDALRANGHLLAAAQRTVSGFTGGSTHGVPTVVLRPGHYASADVEWQNFAPTTGGDCAFSHSIATTPANTTRTVHLTRSVSACGLQVHPTVAGRTGNG
jgi:D-serine deaminase-like pyridoxal phosphate-dependent protein